MAHRHPGAQHPFQLARADTVEFVYLLEWPDEETMKAAWKGFTADEEWAAVKRETGAAHGTFVRSIEDRTLHMTDHSPADFRTGPDGGE